MNAHSQSSSYSEQGSKRLVYNKQLVKVILPTDVPGSVATTDNIVARVANIQMLEVQDARNFPVNHVDRVEWGEYLDNLRANEILGLAVVHVPPISRQTTPNNLPTPSFANSVPPHPFVASPIPTHSPVFPSPYRPAFPQSAGHLVSPPVDWTWSGLGLPTPPRFQSQRDSPGWGVSAVEGDDSPNDPIPEEADDTVLSNPKASPLPTSRKRGYAQDATVSNISEDEQDRTNDMKRQQHSSPKFVVPKRPPFPLTAASRLAKQNNPSHNKKPSSSHKQTSAPSGLNPFATEFVFRPSQPLPAFNPPVKEFSPIHLQQSSKMLFNVFAPEFNPSAAGSSVVLNSTTIFPKIPNDSFFIKPSPTKKPIPIVKPDDNEEDSLSSEGELHTKVKEAEIPDNPEMEDTNTALLSTSSGQPTGEDQIITPDIHSTPPHQPTSDGNDPKLQLPRPLKTRNKRRVSHPQSSDNEFMGYPSFWKHRLLESERKMKKDRSLTPTGAVARSLAAELGAGQEDSSDKENRSMSDALLSECSDDFLFETTRKPALLATQIGKMVKDQLLPVSASLHAIEAAMKKLLEKENASERRTEESDADDEDDELTSKERRNIFAEKIRSIIVDVFRQKGFLPSPPVVVDSPGSDKEIKDLKMIADNLKSKLLDAESSLNREERRRAEYELRSEVLTRDLDCAEREHQLKIDEINDLQSQLKVLQKDYDQLSRAREDEKHAHAQSEENVKAVLKRVNDENAKLSQETASLQSRISTQEGDISDLREQISRARGENGRVTRDRTRLEREIEDERNRFAKLQTEFMQSANEIAERETKWREELSAEKLRVQSLEQSLSDEERRMKKMEEECEKLGAIAEESIKLKAMVESSAQREQNWESVKAVLEKRVYEAEAQVSVSKDERTHFENVLFARLEKEGQGDKAEIATLRETIKASQSERNKISALLDREKMNATLQSAKIDILEQDIRHATQTSLERKTALDSANRDLNDIRSQVSAYQKDIFSLREKIDAKDAQLESQREALDNAKEKIVEKDKLIAQLEFVIAATTTPSFKFGREESDLKLQKREKEIVRLRELLAALVQDNSDFVAHSNEVVAPEQQKKYNAMKNIVRAERERRKALERELAKSLAKDTSKTQPEHNTELSTFSTPASGRGGLDTPVSLRDTSMTLREFTMVENTPVKGKGISVE